MSTIKVCFCSWHYQTNQLFLDTLVKMTPNRSGKWHNMVAVTNPQEADFVFVFDGYSGELPKNRTVYLGQHPNCLKSFRKWEDKEVLLKLPLDQYLNPGEWWISHDYDTLTNMHPPFKTKGTACIMTYQTHNDMYAQRPKFIGELAKYCTFDLYGRPEEKFKADSNLVQHYKGSLGKNVPNGMLGEHLIGKEILIDYTYTIEIDVGPTINYFSERFYDSMLLWCMPVYFGSDNIHQWLPPEAFHYFDIEDLNDVHKIKDIINSDSWAQNLHKISHARDLLLNKYQLWAYCYNIVTNNYQQYKGI